MKLTSLLLASSLLLGAAACGSDSSGTDVGSTDTSQPQSDVTVDSLPAFDEPALDGTEWVLERSGDEVPPEAVAGAITISFEAGTFEAFDGCNSMTGSILWSGDSSDMTFGEFATTTQACEGDIATFSDTYSQSLEAASTLVVDGETLTITTGDGTDLVYNAA